MQDASRALHLYFMAFIFQSLQYSGQTVFKALNKRKRATFFSLFRKVILVVPLTYLLPHIANRRTDGVFMAEPISNVVGGLLLRNVSDNMAGVKQNGFWEREE